MSTLLQHYKITFFRKEFNKIAFYDMTSIDDKLTGIIVNWQKSPDVDAVINTTNNLINGETTRITFTADTLESIDVNSSIVKFYDTPNYNSNSPYFSMPTVDFIQILSCWKEFLVKNLQ